MRCLGDFALIVSGMQPEHLEQSAVVGLQLCAGAERVAQLCLCGTQLLIGQSGQGGWIGSSVPAKSLAKNRGYTHWLLCGFALLFVHG